MENLKRIPHSAKFSHYSVVDDDRFLFLTNGEETVAFSEFNVSVLLPIIRDLVGANTAHRWYIDGNNGVAVREGDAVLRGYPISDIPPWSYLDDRGYVLLGDFSLVELATQKRTFYRGGVWELSDGDLLAIPDHRSRCFFAISHHPIEWNTLRLNTHIIERI